MVRVLSARFSLELTTLFPFRQSFSLLLDRCPMKNGYNGIDGACARGGGVHGKPSEPPLSLSGARLDSRRQSN